MAVDQFGHSDLYRVLWHPQRAGCPLFQDPVTHSGPSEHLWASGNDCTHGNAQKQTQTWWILFFLHYIMWPICYSLKCFHVKCLCIVCHFSWLSVLATPDSMTSWRRAFQMTLSNHCHKVTCESFWSNNSDCSKRTYNRSAICIIYALSIKMCLLNNQERQKGVHCGEVRRASLCHAQRRSRSRPAAWRCEESWHHFSATALCRGSGPGQTTHTAWWTGKDNVEPQVDFHTYFLPETCPVRVGMHIINPHHLVTNLNHNISTDIMHLGWMTATSWQGCPPSLFKDTHICGVFQKVTNLFLSL